MIPDEIVEEVRERADIVEVVGEHVPLKKAGKDFKALCPFHKEKTPSFYVVPAKGFYNCFGCGESGDVYSFLMRHLGLDFQEAVRHLGDKVGVEVPEPGGRRREDPHREIREAVAFAADFYERTLWGATRGAAAGAGPDGARLADEGARGGGGDSGAGEGESDRVGDDRREEEGEEGERDEGERARRYLRARGIAREAAERFRLGCAPAAWRSLREAAHTHGIEDETLIEAGLIKRSDRTDEPYDRLRDRLVFPITDVRGRVVAFGGRVLDDADSPKYLNSPETPIYHKGSVLYGLYWAKNEVRRAGAALVVEGYMDYVSLAAHGVENVVAPLGTSLTEGQATLLARYAKRALLLFDSDAAGLRATFRTGDALLRAGVHPMVVTLPEGEDPDSVVRRGGAEALKPYLDDAVDVVDRKLQILEQRRYLEDVEKLRQALDGLMPTLRATTDAALRDIYIARVAERTGVRRQTLERELAREAASVERSRRRGGRTGRHRRRAGPGEPRGHGGAPGGAEEGGGGGGAESRGARAGVAGQRKLVLLLLRDAEWIARAAEALDPEDFTDPVYREIFELVVRAGAPPKEGDGSGAETLSREARTRLEELRGDPEELFDTERIFRDTVASIRQPTYRRELAELQERIRTAELADDEALLHRLLRTMAELKARQAAEGHARW
ncbi:MAG: CHC2 zinc finger domain-containing protein [Gemmatimonadota bacterium]